MATRRSTSLVMTAPAPRLSWLFAGGTLLAATFHSPPGRCHSSFPCPVPTATTDSKIAVVPGAWPCAVGLVNKLIQLCQVRQKGARKSELRRGPRAHLVAGSTPERPSHGMPEAVFKGHPNNISLREVGVQGLCEWIDRGKTRQRGI
jgi:hypothetical protein